jgi:hypothetical protein
MSRLGISGYIPLLHLHAFVVWTGTTLFFNFSYSPYFSVTSEQFVFTSLSHSWNTGLCKLVKVVVLWVNFGFHFCVWTILHVADFQMLCIVAHLCGKWHLNGEGKLIQGTTYCTWVHHQLYHGTGFKAGLSKEKICFSHFDWAYCWIHS